MVVHATTANDHDAQAPASAPRPRAHARVASHTPGRLRIRVQHPGRHHDLLRKAQERLETHPGTHEVHINGRTGSVLVHYEPDPQTHASVMQLLRDLGMTFGEVARGLDLDAPELSGHSEASKSIVDSFTDLDRQIALMTGHKVDLKLLFPLTLGGVGAWQLATRGLGITEIPAYVLLWYAFDSFWKFHDSRRGTDKTRSVSQPDAQ